MITTNGLSINHERQDCPESELLFGVVDRGGKLVAGITIDGVMTCHLDDRDRAARLFIDAVERLIGQRINRVNAITARQSERARLCSRMAKASGLLLSFTESAFREIDIDEFRTLVERAETVERL